MKETFRILPVYTGDVSGVCSALYELGGMVVIHDPSGCNSTYNTHDEIRWYDKDSLIFISGLRERDAVLGNDDKLIKDVCDAAEVYRPRFTALCNSPVPWLSGTDFRGIAKAIEKRTGIPTFSVATNALHDYTVGAGMAFRSLAEKLFGDIAGNNVSTPDLQADDNKRDASARQRKHLRANCSEKIKINILGMTPLDFADLSEVKALKKMLEEDGFEIISCWAVDDTLEQLRKAPGADVNLAVSSTGLPAAKWMQENLQIPYATGIPAGAAREELAMMLRKTAADGKIRYLGKPEEPGDTEKIERLKEAGSTKNTGEAAEACGAKHLNGPAEIVIIGEPVVSKSLAEDIYLKTGRRAAVLSGLESGQECLDLSAGDKTTQNAKKAISSGFDSLAENQNSSGAKAAINFDTDLSAGDRAVWGEEEMQGEIQKYCAAAAASGKKLTIAADPLYRSIIPDGVRFIEVPHLAFSGRIYLKRMPKLLHGIADIMQS